MPAVLRVGRFRFFFYSNETNEPPHIHVKSGTDEAKYWLDPLELAGNWGFNGCALTQIEELIRFYHTELREAWHEHFDESH